ncbi:MAG: ATP-binding protein [Desulfobulbaceae bacterium]|jgi:two-component system sensor histidine kinase HydH|nr:ATP-binding protein [Desulfobulbaceae bacterium]MDY0351216.1 ATP-binding protein [Desulfobulbaceae bacterium]
MKKKTTQHGIISSWIVIGMSCILVVTVTILAAINYNRQKQGMQQMLSEKGSALIKSFEAGTRTGMMGLFGSESRLQTLLSETASQQDILYIALVDNSGTILAHSEPDRKGEQFVDPSIIEALAATDESAWRILRGDDDRLLAFEVYKKFLPVLSPRHGPQRMRGMRRNMMEQTGAVPPHEPGWMEGLPRDRILDPEQRPAIFVGMDVTPYVEAMEEDFRMTLITSAVIVLLGISGVVSLFWAQSYNRSRKLLQDTRAFAAEMVASLPEGIIVTDPGRRITFINPIALDMLALDPREAANAATADILPPQLNELTPAASGAGSVVEKEVILAGSPDGERITVVSVTDIVSEDGDFLGTMFILRDLTQIRRLQATVQKQEKMAAIGNLAAGIAHEVRNPLSSIKGYAVYFGSLFADDSEKKKAAEVMSAEVDRLNRVISELLELARPSDIKPTPTDLSFLLASSLRLVRQEAEAAGVRITTAIDPDIGPCSLDPDRITQVLINLYINGIQAMPAGGELQITASQTDTGVLIAVADTGTGIPVEAGDKIFDPYYTTKTTGTGLGLAVVRKIVEAHDGTVEVRSDARGALFTIHLPCRKPAPEREGAPAQTPRGRAATDKEQKE